MFGLTSRTLFCKISNNYVTTEITNPWPIWIVAFCKKYSDNFISSHNHQLWIMIVDIMLDAIFDICAWLNISGFHFYWSIIYFFGIFQLFYLAHRCTHFWYHSHMPVIFFAEIVIRLSIKRYSFIWCLINFNAIFTQPWFDWSIVKITTLVSHILFGICQ